MMLSLLFRSRSCSLLVADVSLRLFLCSQVKLSIRGDGSDLQCVWAGKGLLAAANAEPLLRVWHLDYDQSYILPLPGILHSDSNR